MSNTNNLSNITKQSLLATGLVAAASGTVFALDQHLGKREVSTQAEDELEFVSKTPRDADNTVVVLGGLCMNTAEIGENISSQVNPNVNIICPIYPKKGFNADSIIDQTIQKIDSLQSSRLTILSWSMGGLVMLDMLGRLHDNGCHDILNRLDRAVVRGTPFSKDSINKGPKIAMEIANSFLGNSLTLHHGRSALRGIQLALLKEHPSVVIPQVKYLAGGHSNFFPENTELIFVKNIQPDSIVNEDKSIESVSVIAPKLAVVEDPHEHRANHAPTDDQSIRFMMEQAGVDLRSDVLALSRYQYSLVA